MLYIKLGRLQSCSVQGHPQGKISHRTIVRSQTDSTWWERKNLKIRRKNLQTYPRRAASRSPSSLGGWRRPWNCYYSFLGRPLSQENRTNIRALNPKPLIVIDRQVHCHRIWWLLGRDVFCRGLRFHRAAWRPIDCGECPRQLMQGPMVVKQPKQEKRFKDWRPPLPEVRTRRHKRGDSISGVQNGESGGCRGMIDFGLSFISPKILIFWICFRLLWSQF